VKRGADKGEWIANAGLDSEERQAVRQQSVTAQKRGATQSTRGEDCWGSSTLRKERPAGRISVEKATRRSRGGKQAEHYAGAKIQTCCASKRGVVRR